MTLPNQITIARLSLMPVLLTLAWIGLSQWYLGFLIVAFLTDILDGYLARSLDQSSKLGAKLDSIADSVIYMTMIVAAWLLWPDLFTQEIPYILLVICSALALGLFGLYKYKTFTSYHTWLIKFSIVLMGIAYILFFSGGPAWLFQLACLVCVIAIFEEMIITFLLKDPESNVRSLWHLRKIVSAKPPTSASK